MICDLISPPLTYLVMVQLTSVCAGSLSIRSCGIGRGETESLLRNDCQTQRIMIDISPFLLRPLENQDTTQPPITSAVQSSFRNLHLTIPDREMIYIWKLIHWNKRDERLIIIILVNYCQHGRVIN